MIHYEVRKCIMGALKRGMNVEEIVHAYGYGKTAIYNLIKQEKETGSIQPRTSTRGRKPVLDEAKLSEMKARILEKPDITMKELREELGIGLSESQIGRIVHKKLKFTFKKRQYTQANQTDHK